MAGRLLLFVCLCWALFGVFGHEPWQPDEIYTVDLVYHIAQTGDWIVPQLAGEPFVEKPPVFFVTAALFGKLAGGLVQFHNAARLATALYLLLTLLFLRAIAATFVAPADRARDETRLMAPLFMVACVGLFELGHVLQTDISLMCGVTLALLGLARAPQQPRTGGLILGTGVGLAFMSKGLIGPGLTGATTLALFAYPSWRTRTFAQSLVWAALAALPWLVVWPALLYWTSPDDFYTWFWRQNLGRFFETQYSGWGPKAEPWFYTRLLWWFTWPAWPFALYALRRGRAALVNPALQLALAATVMTVTVLALARDARVNYAMPLVPPIALLAALGVTELEETRRRFWFRLGVAGFGLAAAVTWLLWGGFLADLRIAPIEYLHDVFPGYVEHLRPAAVAVAALATAAWAALMIRARAWPSAPAWSWGGGMAFAWVLFAMLVMPAVDHDRSYRPVFTQMYSHVRAGECVCSFALGEPERAMLEYYDALVTQRLEYQPDSRCPYFLMQVFPEPSPIVKGAFARDRYFRKEPPPPALTGSRWTEVWRGHMPTERKIYWVLYQRLPEASSLHNP